MPLNRFDLLWITWRKVCLSTHSGREPEWPLLSVFKPTVLYLFYSLIDIEATYWISSSEYTLNWGFAFLPLVHCVLDLHLCTRVCGCVLHLYDNELVFQWTLWKAYLRVIRHKALIFQQTTHCFLWSTCVGSCVYASRVTQCCRPVRPHMWMTLSFRAFCLCLFCYLHRDLHYLQLAFTCACLVRWRRWMYA